MNDLKVEAPDVRKLLIQQRDLSYDMVKDLDLKPETTKD